jgi:hypothetical protein
MPAFSLVAVYSDLLDVKHVWKVTFITILRSATPHSGLKAGRALAAALLPAAAAAPQSNNCSRHWPEHFIIIKLPN